MKKVLIAWSISAAPGATLPAVGSSTVQPGAGGLGDPKSQLQPLRFEASPMHGNQTSAGSCSRKTNRRRVCAVAVPHTI
jgi:hypothetical protein